MVFSGLYCDTSKIFLEFEISLEICNNIRIKMERVGKIYNFLQYSVVIYFYLFKNNIVFAKLSW